MKKQFILLCLSAFLMGYPQGFQYKIVDKNLRAKTEVSALERSNIKNQYFSNAKSLTCYLPSNYDKTGNTDYTDLLQKGLDENKNVIFPDFPVMVAPKGLALRSNSNVLFLQNSEIRVKPNDKEFYAALNFENVENVKVFFANLQGERYQHQNNKGEWGMGIYIVHSKNIYVYKPHITQFWGDGIYIGKIDGITSKDITIDGAFIDENRRNGISVISGYNIKIENSIISNTYGTIPEYGIDIEPNNPKDELINVVLSSNTTFNNNKGGLLFALDNLQGGKNMAEITVMVENHTDYYSNKGIEFHIDRGYQKFTSPIKGVITITDANLFYNEIPIITNVGQQSRVRLNLSAIKRNNIKITTGKLNTFAEQLEKGAELIIK